MGKGMSQMPRINEKNVSSLIGTNCACFKY